MKKIIIMSLVLIMLSISFLGCTEDTTHKPTASFTIAPPMPQTGELVFFNSTSSDTMYLIESYQWYINDELISEDEQLIHTFEHNGSYEITLTVSNSQGAIDSYSRSLHIGQDSVAKQKILGLWQWEGDNQIGNWTFYENNTLKAVYTGVLPTGEYGASTTAHWTYGIDSSNLYFTDPSVQVLDPGIYSYELLENDTLLRITDLETGSTADWYKSP